MRRRIAIAAALVASPIVLFFVCGLLASPAAAQQPATTSEQAQIEIGPSQVSATPEMWLYLQEMQRHDDPAQAVRRNAEARAAERHTRLAALRAQGLSNGRPRAHRTPMMNLHYPGWNHGSGYGYYLPIRGVVVGTEHNSLRR